MNKRKELVIIGEDKFVVEFLVELILEQTTCFLPLVDLLYLVVLVVRCKNILLAFSLHVI
jgi:hypothetical protein